MINHEYETIYITQPDLAETDFTRLSEKLNGVIEHRAGSVLVAEDWGRRKLAYPIRKHNYGVYVYLNYVGPADLTLEVERNLRYEECVIRFLTVRLAENVDAEERRVLAEERQRKRAETRAAQEVDDDLDHDDAADPSEADDAGDDD